jgi:copper chaperone
MTDTVELAVGGMSCEHCVRAVTGAIQAEDPQAQVQVDLAAGRVRATTTLPRDRVSALVQEEGYTVQAAA